MKIKLITITSLLLVCLLSGSCASIRDFDNRLNSIVRTYRFSIAKWESVAIQRNPHRIGRWLFGVVKYLAGLVYRNAQIVCPVTPRLEASLKTRGVELLKIIANGADVSTFTPFSGKKKTEEFRIFFSGWLGTYYRVDVVLKAVQHLTQQGHQDIGAGV